MSRRNARAIASLASALAALAAGHAWGFVGEATSYSGGISRTTTTGPGSGTVAPVSGGGVTVTGQVQMRTPTGGTVPMTQVSTVTRAGVARMAGRVVAGLLGSPVVWGGIVVWDIYRQTRQIPAPGGGGTFVRDEGIPATLQQSFCLNLPSGAEVCGAGPSGPVSALAAYYNATNHEDVPATGQNAYFQLGYCDAVGCFIGVTRYTNGVITTPYNAYGEKINPTQKMGLRCPTITGQFGELYQDAPYADGKCAGGASAPMTAEQAAQVAAAIQNIDWQGIMADVTGRDPAAPWAPSGVEHEFMTPSPLPTVPGTTSTTTTATGSTTTATEFRLRDVMPRTPEGARARWTERTTVTQMDPEGAAIGTPTVTETETAPSTPAEDPCQANPDRVGCMNAGQVDDVELENQDRSVSVTPAAGFGADTAACPAPRQMVMSFGTIGLPWTPVCDFASGLRPFILAVTAMICAYMLLGLRSGGEA